MAATAISDEVEQLLDRLESGARMSGFEARLAEKKLREWSKSSNTSLAANAYVGLAKMCALAGDFKGAMGFHRSSLGLRPNDPNLLANMAVTLGAFGKYSEAIPVLRRSASLVAQPYRPIINYNLAVALHETGERDEARAVFREVMAEIPDAQARLLASKLVSELADEEGPSADSDWHELTYRAVVWDPSAVDEGWSTISTHEAERVAQLIEDPPAPTAALTELMRGR